ncbi:MgtC/SapB family protein [Streptacidiphilus sp. 4-A2]|nr:MgtC/SapB family protein [Streptacidiphilus sp. 4-A2]
MAEHLLCAFALTYTLGFERAVRGAAAGDRTFSLIGVGAAVVAALSQNGAPNVLTGVITGVGFIGGGLTFRQSLAEGEGEMVRGITTAATIFAAAAIGAAAGEGLLLLAVTGTLLALLTLEIRHIPLLRLLEARRWARHYGEDELRPPPRRRSCSPSPTSSCWRTRRPGGTASRSPPGACGADRAAPTDRPPDRPSARPPARPPVRRDGVAVGAAGPVSAADCRGSPAAPR